MATPTGAGVTDTQRTAPDRETPRGDRAKSPPPEHVVRDQIGLVVGTATILGSAAVLLELLVR